MWSDGGPIDPSPTIDQAINGGFSWLEIKCSRCLTPRDVDLCALPHVPTTFVHDLAGRLVCQMQEGREAPGCDATPACTAPASSAAEELRDRPNLNWSLAHTLASSRNLECRKTEKCEKKPRKSENPNSENPSSRRTFHFPLIPKYISRLGIPVSV
jgi:hypothetical protein